MCVVPMSVDNPVTHRESLCGWMHCRPLSAWAVSAMSQLDNLLRRTLQLHNIGLCTAMQGWLPMRCAVAGWEGPTSVVQVGNSSRACISAHGNSSMSSHPSIACADLICAHEEM